MKLSLALGAFVGAVMSIVGGAPSWALTCGGVECGSTDLLLGSGQLANSSLALEEAFLESFALQDLQLVQQFSGSPDFVDGSSDLVYTPLYDEASYFLVKTGGGAVSITGDTHFVFQNLSELAFGIISLAEMGLRNIGGISHYTSVVPLPAAAWLLLSAVFGLFAVGRTRGRTTA